MTAQWLVCTFHPVRYVHSPNNSTFLGSIHPICNYCTNLTVQIIRLTTKWLTSRNWWNELKRDQCFPSSRASIVFAVSMSILRWSRSCHSHHMSHRETICKPLGTRWCFRENPILSHWFKSKLIITNIMNISTLPGIYLI